MKLKHLYLLPLISLCLVPSVSALANGSVAFELLATFNRPGFPDTFAYKINDEGYVACSVFDRMGHAYGFTRDPAGHASHLISYPNSTASFTIIYGINNLLQLCGSYNGGPRPGDAFLLRQRKFVRADFSDAPYNDISDLNDAGNFCGDYSYGASYTAFVNIDRTYTSFAIPEQTFTGALDINNLNQCVGWYENDFGAHAFFREADGSITFPIDAPGFTFTLLYGLDDTGRMVGEAGNVDGTNSAVLFLSPSEVALYSYPGASTTVFSGINNNGTICGYYTDDQFFTHGFIVQVE